MVLWSAMTPKPEATSDRLISYLLAIASGAHVVGGRRDIDVVIVTGEWHRTVLSLIEELSSDEAHVGGATAGCTTKADEELSSLSSVSLLSEGAKEQP